MVEIERTQEMVDIIHGTIVYSGIESAVIGTPIFNRLHRIMQSSMVYLTFPANKVKRFEHSIGVMHLAGKFFFHSICNSDEEQLKRFFDEVDAELVNWNSALKKKDIPYIDNQNRTKYQKEKILNLPFPQCRLYVQNTPANLLDKQRLGYYVVYQALRLAGLLHDVGHLPYSHVLEHSLQSLYDEVKKIPEAEHNDAHKHFLDVMQKYCASEEPAFAIHEELGAQFVDKIFDSITDSLPKQENAFFYFLAAVLYFTQGILAAKDGDNTLFSDLHRIVAGTLDCDRMDYCCRDTYCAGTNKELTDYARILSTVSIVYHATPRGLAYQDAPAETREHCYFMPSTKAIHEIEDFLRRRWSIYATINYHHRVHKHELLLIQVLTALGLAEMKDGKAPKELEDILPLQISSIWQLVEQMTGSASVDYFAIQLDDSWMDTLLKHKYFQKYGDSYLSFKENGNDVTWHQLDELISAQKHYCTLFKRPGGFRQFDILFYKTLRSMQDGDVVEQQLSDGYTQTLTAGGEPEYVFNRMLRELFKTKADRDRFFAKFNSLVHQMACDEGSTYHIADCFLADSSFSLGISLSEPLYIRSSRQKAKPFGHYSPLYSVLTSEKKLFPSVHIYYLPTYDEAHSEYEQVEWDTLINAMAEKAVAALLECYGKEQILEALPKLPDRQAEIT